MNNDESYLRMALLLYKDEKYDIDHMIYLINKYSDKPGRISHFIDENGNNVDINAGGVIVKLKRDGTHEYFRNYGFAGFIKLTPVFID